MKKLILIVLAPIAGASGAQRNLCILVSSEHKFRYAPLIVY